VHGRLARQRQGLRGSLCARRGKGRRREKEGRAAEWRGGLSRFNWKILTRKQRIGGRERGKGKGQRGERSLGVGTSFFHFKQSTAHSFA